MLGRLGRHAEALADCRRAIKACEVDPDYEVEGHGACHRFERILAEAPPESTPRRLDGPLLEKRKGLGR
jgi:hypothetical protein